MTRTAGTEPVASPFVGDSEMARRCREFDWAATSLGPVERWPVALRSAVRLMLECPMAICLWCGRELLQLYNDGYVDFLGHKHPWALGKPGLEVWEELRAMQEPWFASLWAGGPALHITDNEVVLERHGGEKQRGWFTFSMSPIRDDDGSIVGFFNPTVETTPQKVLERDLRESHAVAERALRYLREIFAQAPAFLAVLRGEDLVFDFANAAYLRLIGDRDVVGRPLTEALPEVVEQGFVDLLLRVLATGEPYVGRGVPVMLRRGDGPELEERFVDFVYQPVTDAEGNRTGIVVHGADVTESMRARREVEWLLEESELARAALEASEARFRFLTNAIPVQVWTAAPDGRVEYVSDRMAREFARSTDELLAEGWRSVVHPDDVEATSDRWRQAIATGTDYEVQARLWSDRHGAYRWYLGRATPQRDLSGAIIRWFGTNIDIDDAKQAEAELQRLTFEATAANQAKSAFLAAMSHELRTPLNAIGGYAQLIEMGVRGPVTEEQRQDLARIQRSKTHLEGLVGDVLSFAKLGSGRIELEVRDVGVQALLESVVEMVTPQLAEKGLVLDVPVVEAEVSVRADEDKLRQILVNLLANALKFTPRGGRIGVTVRATGDTVRLAVADTGAGIPAAMHERIFEPFVQAKQAVPHGERGVGLGLAISRTLARAMGGDLTVVSEVGAGSTFTLALPA